jgi:nucleoid DNA-binding protein
MKSAAIIDALGGTVEVSKLCKVKPQAVSQWFGVDPQTGKERQIPAARLMYLKAIKRAIFARLESEAKAA